MAVTPFFVISPNAILSIIGLLRGPDKTEPTPAEDWHQAVVDVVIPTLNEERNIALCLGSLERQTLKPRRIYIIDDGSKDRTIAYAEKFTGLNDMKLEIIRRKAPIGKTPTIKRQSRESDADVEFILDGDTVLESINYIERTVEELYKAVGIGCACGTILPLCKADRLHILALPSLKRFLEEVPDAPIYPSKSLPHRLNKFVSNTYREALYMFLQKFIYHGQMVFFGSITNPVGCAVAYRRKYVKDVFDKYEPILGDDLTNSEDIFIGFALVDKGYRNIQLGDVYARSMEPQANRLPVQAYKWSSSFLQSCYYFNDLILSPFKSLKNMLFGKRKSKEEKEEIREKRKIREPYRQPFGEDFTHKGGRPVGWAIFMGAVEKIFFPTTLVLMAIFGLWEIILLTMVIETALSVGILLFISRAPAKNRYYKQKYRGLRYFFKGLLLSPIRYLSVLYDLVTVVIFFFQVRIIKKRKWRK